MYGALGEQVNKFDGFCRNSVDSVRTEFKNRTNYCSRIKNFKKSGKYYKKLEQILSILVKKYLQICIICLVKIQNLSNLHHFQISLPTELVWFCC
jgi:hypothetical protein